jgi:hypothetical protein
MHNRELLALQVTQNDSPDLLARRPVQLRIRPVAHHARPSRPRRRYYLCRKEAAGLSDGEMRQEIGRTCPWRRRRRRRGEEDWPCRPASDASLPGRQALESPGRGATTASLGSFRNQGGREVTDGLATARVEGSTTRPEVAPQQWRQCTNNDDPSRHNHPPSRTFC